MSWLIAGPFMYLAFLVFVVLTGRKVFAIMRMPRHLRWDLYPVAHDGEKGSIYQEVDHWEKPRRYSLAHELAEMAEEILLLKRTFLHNRRMWNFSFPMHFAFYLLMAWMAALVAGVLLEFATGVKISGNSTVFWALALHYKTVVIGVSGLALGLFGTLGLLWIRLTDEDLRDFTSPISFLNLLLLGALFAVGLVAWFTADPGFVLARGYVGSLLTFRPEAGLPAIMLAEILLFGAFLIYLPFSRMLHFAAKYFFYHNVMWEDEPVVRGGDLEKAIGGYLHYRMRWSARHIVPNETWLTQATTNPAKGSEKKS